MGFFFDVPVVVGDVVAFAFVTGAVIADVVVVGAGSTTKSFAGAFDAADATTAGSACGVVLTRTGVGVGVGTGRDWVDSCIEFVPDVCAGRFDPEKPSQRKTPTSITTDAAATITIIGRLGLSNLREDEPTRFSMLVEPELSAAWPFRSSWLRRR